MISILLIAGCLGPERGADYQEQWMVLGINSDSSLLDVRFASSNSGMLAGQGHVRLDWVPLQEGNLGYARKALLSDMSVEDSGIQVGPDSLQKDSDQWVLKIQSGELDSRIQVENLILEPQSSTTDSWRMDTLFAGPMQGVLRAESRSKLIKGYAVGVRAWGNSPPSLQGQTRRSAFVLGEDLAIGIDQRGSQATAFAVIAGQQLDASTAVLRKDTSGYIMDFQPATDLEVRLMPRRPHRQTSPWDHLYTIERWVAGLRYGHPVHRIRAADAQIRLGDRQLKSRAIISVNDFSQ